MKALAALQVLSDDGERVLCRGWRSEGTASARLAVFPAAEHPASASLLQWVAAGKSNKEIGAQLFIAEGTVKTHVKNLLQKLAVVGRTAAIREAVHRGLVRLN